MYISHITAADADTNADRDIQRYSHRQDLHTAMPRLEWYDTYCGIFHPALPGSIVLRLLPAWVHGFGPARPCCQCEVLWSW